MEIKALITKIAEYLYVEDIKLIYLIFAIMISRMQRISKLFIIIIGKSGDGKTTLLDLFDDDGETTATLTNITPNTLVNGRHGKKRFPDLAPQLKDKVILLPEMAQLISLQSDSLRQVMAQIRDLYDGKAGKSSGDGLNILYTDLNVTLVGCSTPMIENKVLVHQNLGTRELLYKTDDKNEAELMKRIVQNTELDKIKKKKELKDDIKEFLKYKNFDNSIIIDTSTLNRIKQWALFTAKMRATGQIDYKRTWELIGDVHCEAPTRVLENFIVLFKCLKSLDKDITDNFAVEIIKKVALSSCSTNRIKVLLKLMEYSYTDENFSTRKISSSLNLSKNTVYAELNTLTALQLCNKNEIIIDALREDYQYKFRINKENELIQFISAEFGIKLQAEIIEETIK